MNGKITTPEALAVLQAIAESGFVRDNAPADAVAHLASRIAELEGELAAAKVDSEWSAKMAEFIGPGALAYMWREFNAAREGK